MNRNIFKLRYSWEDGSSLNTSKIRKNREYLISKDVSNEMNTYLSFDPFWTITSQYHIDEGDEIMLSTREEDAEKRKTLMKNKKLKSPLGVRSIFNKNAAVSLAKSDAVFKDSEWRISNNVPLMDSRATRELIKSTSDCSVRNLIKASEKGLLGMETYSYSDFMYCKYLGKLPNNYMVTLRRFPFPVDDFISLIGVSEKILTDPDLKNGNAPSLGCMVTWMGTPGNDMSNILKYSYKMPFKELTALWLDAAHVDASSEVKNGRLFNNIAAAFDPTYMKQATLGLAALPFNTYIEKLTGGSRNNPFGENPYNVETFSGWLDANKVYGPVDAVKTTYLRSDEGLKFDLNITLTFDYELKAYNGINARLAMLDLIANILAVTYITGNWWKGGYRGGGAHQSNIFSNLKIFKTSGGFNDFVDAFAEDYSTVTQGFRDKLKAAGGDNWLESALNLMKSALNTMGGMMLGGMLNRLGRPIKGMANSLLSGAAVGFWHITIGNPFHPIMSMGNMILTNTTIEHYGPLGIDDFPTGLRVTCELTRGKAKDLRSIESLYMHGNDRIYSPMTGEVRKMYEKAKEYQQTTSYGSNIERIQAETNSLLNGLGANIVQIENSDLQLVKKNTNEENKNDKIGADKTDTINQINQSGEIKYSEGLLDAAKVYLKYFGTTDLDAIDWASREYEFGAQSLKKDK